MNRLKIESYHDEKRQKIFDTKYYFYNSLSQVEKIVKKSNDESYQSYPEMVRFKYDNKGRIIKEEYCTYEGGKAIMGEMGVRFITYKYNSNNLIKESIFHYTGTVDVKTNDEPKYRWLNEYIYDDEQKLIESRYKFEIESEEYDNITYYKYDKENKLYGKGKNKEDIETIISYCNAKNIPL